MSGFGADFMRQEYLLILFKTSYFFQVVSSLLNYYNKKREKRAKKFDILKLKMWIYQELKRTFKTLKKRLIT